MEPEKRPARPQTDPRLYLAAERTFLAWIRTGLALMGFGFVLARFGFFLRELNSVRISNQPVKAGASVRFGTALVILGVVLTVAAVVRYRRLIERLRDGESLAKPSRMAVALGVALAIIGSLVAVYLLLTP